MTVLEILKGSLRAIKVLAPGRTPGQSEITDALFGLNAMLRKWATNSLRVYATTRGQYSLAAASSYTIGPAGDIALTERPVEIVSAATIEDDRETPIDVIAHNGSPSRIGLYYRASWPSGVLTPYPEWDTAKTLVLYMRTVFAEIDDEDADVVFPPGYEDAILYNLAVRLSLEWPQAVLTPEVKEQARLALAEIQSLNLPRTVCELDSAIFPRR